MKKHVTARKLALTSHQVRSLSSTQLGDTAGASSDIVTDCLPCPTTRPHASAGRCLQ